MASPPTATSFAVLGLLGLQPWTAYDLVAQTRRSLHFFWPRSEAHLYAELKRLVERGHAHAEIVEGRRRQATRYTITPQGRAALEEWLATEPAPPTIEIEALLRVLFADHGSPQDLRAALLATTRQSITCGWALVSVANDAARHRWSISRNGCTWSNGSARCTASFSCCSTGGVTRPWPRSRLGRTRAKWD